MTLKLPKRVSGYRRVFSQCAGRIGPGFKKGSKATTCNQVQFSDFIPFGLGQGIRYNSCQCQLTGHNTHLLRTITRKQFEKLFRAQLRAHRKCK